MIEYFIVKGNGRRGLGSGFIIACNNGDITLDNERIGDITKADLLSEEFSMLSDIKAKYLSGIQLSKRVKIFESGLFEKIEQLKSNDLCDINVQRKRHRFSIIRRNTKNNSFLAHKEDGIQTSISIFDIVAVVDVEYYICLSQYKSTVAGSIVRTEDGVMKTYPSGERIDGVIPELAKLSKEEAVFLCKFPPQHRLEVHASKLWDSIYQMTAGSKCYLKGNFDGPLYEFIGKDSVDGDKYLFRSPDKKTVRVDVSEVRPETTVRRTSVVNPEPNSDTWQVLDGDSATGRASNADVAENKAEARSWFGWLGGAKADKSTDMKSQHCDTNNIDCVEFTPIRSMVTDSKVDKLIILSYARHSSAVRLRWRGEINGRMCLGCELDRPSQHGTNGTFGQYPVFRCSDGRGVLILLDASVECCAGPNRRHRTLKCAKNTFIDPSCICCAESAEGAGDTPIVLSEEYRGTVRWRGRVNGRECVGVDVDGFQGGTNGTFNGIRLFASQCSNGTLAPLGGVARTIRCDTIDTGILNPTTVTSIQSTGTTSKLVVLGEEQKHAVEVVWRGTVDGVECAGCILPFKYRYGTDGTFDGERLFDGGDNRGVLIANHSLDCLSDGRKHREVRRLSNNSVDADSICCIEPTSGAATQPPTVPGDFVGVMFGAYKQFGTLLWRGRINGMDACGLSLEVDHSIGTDGTFFGKRLFQCSEKCGYIYLSSDTHNVLEPSFEQEKFLRKEFDIAGLQLKKSGDMIGKLVRVSNDPLYGRVGFHLSISNESLYGIVLAPSWFKKYAKQLNDVLFNEDLIIVRFSHVEIFKEELQSMPKSDIIDTKSVKVDESYKSDKNKVGDVVSYRDGDGLCFGRIVTLSLLNGIGCVGVVDPICGGDASEAVYIIEDKVATSIGDSSIIKFHEDTILYPRSITTLTPFDDDSIKTNDDIEFRLRVSLQRFQGKVIRTVRANTVPSVVVALSIVPKAVDISDYQINGMKSFKSFVVSERKTVIVAMNAVQLIPKKFLICDTNKVAILDPACTVTFNKSRDEDKTIRFKGKDSMITARLKCVGRINSDVFIGCEMSNDSVYGTDGTFGGVRLFNCSKSKGVLIPLNEISECCINGSHKQLLTSTYGRIISSTICCVQTVTQLSVNGGLRIGERVMRTDGADGQLFGTCRWLGIVNGQKVVGVEVVTPLDIDPDATLDELALFECPSNVRGLFLSDSVTHNPTIFNETLDSRNLNNSVIRHSSSNVLDRSENVSRESFPDSHYIVLSGSLNSEYSGIMVVSDNRIEKYQGNAMAIPSEITLNNLLSKSIPISETEAKASFAIQTRMKERMKKDFPDNNNNLTIFNFQYEYEIKLGLIDPSTCRDILNYDQLQNLSKSEACCEKIPETESSSECHISDSEYEQLILHLSEDGTLREYTKFISCIKMSLRMSEPKITRNIVTNSQSVIDLKTDAALFDLIVQRGDVDTIVAILRRCETSDKDNPVLVKLMERHPIIDIISLATVKIKGTEITDELNRSLLRLAFSFADWKEDKGFDMVMSSCTNIDDFVDGNNTFLTKMIIERSSDDVQKVMDIYTFDINKHNANGKAPIVLACERQPDSEMLEYLVKYSKERETPFNTADIHEGYSIGYQDKEIKSKFCTIIDGCKRQ